MGSNPEPCSDRKTPLPWFRLYIEVLNDPKVQHLSDRQFRGWINLLCVASKYNGVLPSTEEIAFLLRIKPANAQRLLEEMRHVGLLDEVNGHLAPHNWKGRQYESDHSTSRVKRFRARRRDVPRNVSTTVSETLPDAETETELVVSYDTTTVTAVEQPDIVVASEKPRRSLIRPEAFTLADQIAAAMGLAEEHPTRVGMPMKVEHWLTTWHPEIILMTVQSIMATRPNDPPNNLNYFEKPIARAHAEQSRPMPVINPPAETINVLQKNGRRGGSLIAAIDQELNKLEIEEEAHLAVPKDAILRLPG
jgi:hypothetical protein